MVQFGNEIIRIAQEIERYLLTHPYAADSLEGVVKWWIARQCFEESYDHVQQALDFLIARGRIRKTMNTDGTYIYSIQTNTKDGYSK